MKNNTIIDPRQTGRSLRIAQFAVDQLLGVGEVIIADHVVYQFPKLNKIMSTEALINKVKRLLSAILPYEFKLNSKSIKVDDKWVIHFKLSKTE